jgi:hypothetical protein
LAFTWADNLPSDNSQEKSEFSIAKISDNPCSGSSGFHVNGTCRSAKFAYAKKKNTNYELNVQMSFTTVIFPDIVFNGKVVSEYETTCGSPGEYNYAARTCTFHKQNFKSIDPSGIIQITNEDFSQYWRDGDPRDPEKNSNIPLMSLGGRYTVGFEDLWHLEIQVCETSSQPKLCSSFYSVGLLANEYSSTVPMPGADARIENPNKTAETTNVYNVPQEFKTEITKIECNKNKNVMLNFGLLDCVSDAPAKWTLKQKDYMFLNFGKSDTCANLNFCGWFGIPEGEYVIQAIDLNNKKLEIPYTIKFQEAITSIQGDKAHIIINGQDYSSVIYSKNQQHSVHSDRATCLTTTLKNGVFTYECAAGDNKNRFFPVTWQIIKRNLIAKSFEDVTPAACRNLVETCSWTDNVNFNDSNIQYIVRVLNSGSFPYFEMNYSKISLVGKFDYAQKSSDKSFAEQWLSEQPRT